MKVHPSSQRLLVKWLVPAEKSVGGVVVIPEALRERVEKESQMARVLAAGPGRLLDDGARLDPVAAEGDVVVLYKGSGHEVAVDGEELRMVHESEVLGVAVAEPPPAVDPASVTGGSGRCSPSL